MKTAKLINEILESIEIDQKHQNIILEYQRVIQKREKCNHII